MKAARKAKPKAKSKRSKSMAEEIDAELAEAARKKRTAGEKPTRDELAALRREDARVDREALERHVAAVPKTLVADAMALQTVQIHRLADRWSVPLRGRTVNLLEVLRWLRDFLDANADRLDVDVTEGASTAALERLRQRQADRIEMDLQTKRRQLRSVDEVRKTFEFIASVFRKASQELRVEFGPRAFEILESAVEDAKRMIDTQYKPSEMIGTAVVSATSAKAIGGDT
jgi:hypothetical protein